MEKIRKKTDVRRKKELMLIKIYKNKILLRQKKCTI